MTRLVRVRAALRAPATWGFAVFLVVTLAWLAPLLPHFGSAVLEGESDATIALRAYWAMEEAGKTPFTWTRDDLNGAPEGLPRPPAPEFVSPVLSTFVWTAKGVIGRTAALNLFVALGFLLTGFSVFLLLSHLRFGFLPSLFGGYVAAFNPWMFDRAVSGHVTFLHGWVLVLLLWALLRLRERRTLARAAVAGAAYGLSFSVAAYFGLLATAIVAAFVIVDLVTSSDRLWTATLLTAILATASLFLLPGLTAFLLDRSTVVRALTNPLEQLDTLAASPVSYVVPSPRHPVLGGLGDAARPDDPLEEKVLFFGYTTLALAVAAFFLRDRFHGRMRRLLLLVAAVVPIAFLASLPRSLDVFGVGIPTPAYVIGEVTSFYRVYARFGYVVGLGLAVLAAAALSQLAVTRRGQALAVVATVVVVLELLVGRMSAYRIDVAPDYDRWLAEQPRGIVAHYPMPTDKRQALQLAGHEITFQPLTGQPLYTIFGAGTGGTREDAIRILTRHLGDPVTPGVLAAEGVRYVVVHEDVYREQGESPPPIPPSLTPLRSFGDVTVYALRAPPADVDEELEQHAATIAQLQGLRPATFEFADGFNPPEEFRTGEQWRWMTQAGRLDVENPNPVTSPFVIEGVAFSSEFPRQLGVTTPESDVLAGAEIPERAIRVRIGPFDLPPGRTQLVLYASPGPEPLGGGSARVGSVYFSPLRFVALPDYDNTLRAGGGE
jgi:hypothetical protein